MLDRSSTVLRTVLRRAVTASLTGPLVDRSALPALSAPWLEVDSAPVSAPATAPPALPMTRPARSRQIPATLRTIVLKMGVSVRQVDVVSGIRDPVLPPSITRFGESVFSAGDRQPGLSVLGIVAAIPDQMARPHTHIPVAALQAIGIADG